LVAVAATDGSLPRSYADAERNEALSLYLEVGAAEASRRCGVPAGTIRQWAHRRGLTTARTASARASVEAARLTWAQRRAEVATRAGEGAATFLDDAIAEKSARNRRDLMAAFKMAAEGAQLLSGGATERVELTEEQRRERVRELRDELAARREAKAAG
jgi:hypothetical protein